MHPAPAHNAPVTTETAPKTQPTLTAADRCDQCGARAYVRVAIPSGTLLFCGHHYSASEQILRLIATEILDERHLILSEERDAAAAFV